MRERIDAVLSQLRATTASELHIRAVDSATALAWKPGDEDGALTIDRATAFALVERGATVART
jgi:hypothetical protein